MKIRDFTFVAFSAVLFVTQCSDSAAAAIRAHSNPSNAQQVGNVVSFRPITEDGEDCMFRYKIRPWGSSISTVVREWDSNPNFDWDTKGFEAGRYFVAIICRNGVDASDYEYSRGFKSFELTSNPALNDTWLLDVTEKPLLDRGEIRLAAGATTTTGAEFRFLAFHESYGDIVIRDWGPSETIWDTRGLPSGRIRVGVQARRAINGVTTYEAERNYSLHLPDELPLSPEPEFVLDPYGRTPLAGLIRIESPVPTKPTLSIQSADAEETRVAFERLALEHSVPVVGLRPAMDYDISVWLERSDGSRHQIGPFGIHTPELPDDFPRIDVVESIPESMEPGFIVLGRFGRAPGEPVGYTIILNQRGQVVWYTSEGSNKPLFKPGGRFLFQNGNAVFEMTLVGDKRRVTTLEDAGFALHHEFTESFADTYLALTRERLPVEDYPSSETDPAAPLQTAEIEDNPVVEFLLDGTIRKRWRLSEILDPTRIGYMSLGVTDAYTGGLDWAHANSVYHDPRDDTLVVSVRHQDAVIKFSRNTGELKWILGNHNNWEHPWSNYLLTPVGNPFAWQYHQHSAIVLANGNIMLFDNGNFRASPFDGTEPMKPHQSYSRAVEYEVDEKDMTVRQVWEYGRDELERLFSYMVSEAEPLPETGNVLITFGGVNTVNGVNSSALGYGKKHARVMQVTKESPAYKVFDVRVYDPNAIRTTIYRSGIVESLY